MQQERRHEPPPQWQQPQSPVHPECEVYRQDTLGNLVNARNINKRHPLQNLATMVFLAYFFICSTTLYALANLEYRWAVSNLGLFLIENTQIFFGYMGLYAVVAYSLILATYSFVIKHDSASRIMSVLIVGSVFSMLLSGFSLLYGYDIGEEGQNLLGHMTVGFLIEFVFGELGTHIVYWAIFVVILIKVIESQTDWRLMDDVDRLLEDLKKKWKDSYESITEEIKALPKPNISFLKQQPPQETAVVKKTRDSLEANPAKQSIKEKQSIPPTIPTKTSVVEKATDSLATKPVNPTKKTGIPVKKDIPLVDTVQPIQHTENTDDAIQIMNARELADVDYEKPKLILDWFAESELCMIHADPKAGKTRLALSIAHAVATGGEILGWHARGKRQVLYVDGEMGKKAMSHRMGELNGERPEELIIYSYDMYKDFPNICRQEGQRLIEAVIQQKHLKEGSLIVLDNLKTLSQLENENQVSYATFQKWFLSLRSRGYSVILLHHNNKTGKQDGTGNKKVIINTTISLTLPKNYKSNGQEVRFILDFNDVRESHSCNMSSFEAIYRDGVWKRIDDDDSIKVRESPSQELMTQSSTSTQPTAKQVVLLARQGLTQSDIAVKLNISQGTVSKVLNRYKELQQKRSEQ